MSVSGVGLMFDVVRTGCVGGGSWCLFHSVEVSTSHTFVVGPDYLVVHNPTPGVCVLGGRRQAQRDEMNGALAHTAKRQKVAALADVDSDTTEKAMRAGGGYHEWIPTHLWPPPHLARLGFSDF